MTETKNPRVIVLDRELVENTLGTPLSDEQWDTLSNSPAWKQLSVETLVIDAVIESGMIFPLG